MKKKGIGLIVVVFIGGVLFAKCGTSDKPHNSEMDNNPGKVVEEIYENAENLDEEDDKDNDENQVEKKKQTKTKKEKKEKKEKKNTGVSKELKQTLDEYEKYIDEYIEFMEKYTDSSDPISMLEDYNEMMEQYQKVMDGMEKLEKSDMTAEEEVYFIKVQNRINEKLLEASLS